MRYLKILVILFLFSCSITYGQLTVEHLKDQPYMVNKDMVDCNDAYTTMEMRICTNLKCQESISAMNKVYNEILEAIKNDELYIDDSLFFISQEKWLV